MFQNTDSRALNDFVWTLEGKINDDVCNVMFAEHKRAQTSSKTLPVNGRKAMYHWVLCKALDGYVDFRPSSDEMETMAAAGDMTVQQVRGWFTNNRRRFMNQSPLSLRYDAANQLYRLYRFHQLTPAADTDVTRPPDDTSSSSDEDRPEGVNGGPTMLRSPSTAAATQRARHQPAEVLRFAAGLADRSEMTHTRSHWEALVLVAATYSAELSQS